MPGETFFEQLETGQSVSVVGYCFHWQDPENTALQFGKIRSDRPLYISDEIYTWANPHLEKDAHRLYELSCVFRRPLVLLQQYEPFEDVFSESNQSNWDFVRKAGFDSIVYTPHKWSRGDRQAILLEPMTQVLSLRELINPDMGAIARKRQSDQKQWERVMTPGPSKSPIVTDKRKAILELDVMAHRYLYYVLASPTFTDHEYDLLEREARAVLAENSPVHDIGSSLPSSYNSEQILRANELITRR